MNRVRAFCGLGLALLVAGCAAEAASPETVLLAPRVFFATPSPAALGRQVEAVQMVSARHRGETFTFEGRLTVSPDRLFLVGTDGFGRRIMSITWNGTKLTSDRAAWVPEGLRPENVLADITLMFWPEAVIREGLGTAGVTLASDATSRTVTAGGLPIVTIRYEGADPWSGVSRLHNHSWGYDIEVHSQVLTQ